jgi:hypothetical protein
MIKTYGDDGRLFLLRCLLEEIDFGVKTLDKSPRSPPGTTAAALKDAFKIQLLTQELSELSTRPNFASIVGRALEVRARWFS